MTQTPRERRKKPRNGHPNWPLRWLWVALAGIAAVYLLYRVRVAGDPSQAGYSLIGGLFDIACVAWAFGVGSAMGSFLNVVAWRLPRGKSVNGRSHCPYCAEPIAARDNIPVIGWIALRGRCRVCRLPISPRYPMVEGIVGVTLMLLGLCVLYRGAAYLPLATAKPSNNWPLRVASLEWREYAAMAYLYAAGASLWAIALVRFEGHRVTPGLTLIVLIAVAGPQLAMPSLQPLPWQTSIPIAASSARDTEATTDEAPNTPRRQPLRIAPAPSNIHWQGTSRLDTALSLSLGAMAGVVLTWLLKQTVWPVGKPQVELDPEEANHLPSGALRDAGLSAALAGMLMGWHALIGLLPILICVTWMLRRIWQHRDPVAAWMLAIPLVIAPTYVLWPWLQWLSLWPAPGHSIHAYWISLVVAIGLSVVAPVGEDLRDSR